jgi:biopolymer transport protein ExbD
MRRWKEEENGRARVEIVPMIDVMMFLLVFFVLLSINVLPATGVKAQLPGSAAPDRLDAPKVVMVGLERTGDFSLDGKSVSLEQLAASLQAKSREIKSLSVIVAGDADVELQQLVDAMDAIKASGISSVAIAAKRK